MPMGTWLELPEDILMRIFATMEIPDLTRAGSVCLSWHSAYSSLCRLGLYRRQQTPCLLYTSAAGGASAASLYSLEEEKAYTLTLPDPPICSRHIIGSSYGWIITADERSELHLVNPITGEQVALPSVTTIEQVKPVFDDAGVLHKYKYSWYTGQVVVSDSPSIFALGDLRHYLFYKAFISSDPSMSDYIVVLIHNPHTQLSFARGGDDRWTWLPPRADYEDCLFKDGLLYALTEEGEIHAYDLSGPAVTQKIIMDKMKDIICEKMYIVQAPHGDLLQIWRSCDLLEDDEDEDVSEPDFDPEAYVCMTTMIEVYKVDFSAKKLVKTSGLGENALFIGHNQSLCLHSGEHPQLKANQVYFTDNNEEYIKGFKNNRRDIGVFNLENNSSEEIVSPPLWSNWPTPVWIVPNPRKVNMTMQN
uniref:F-box domain-containing protein n=1 Tax=Arundo donax TaxID=35708 RepID=A0A0A8XPV5_ARUDO